MFIWRVSVVLRCSWPRSMGVAANRESVSGEPVTAIRVDRDRDGDGDGDGDLSEQRSVQDTNESPERG